MAYELHDLNVIRATENEGNVDDSTTLLHLPEVEAPTMNDDIVSGVYNASMSSGRSFDHHSEDDLYVRLMSFGIIYLPMFSPPGSPRKGSVHQ